MERDFDALAKDLQANLTSGGCINKDVGAPPRVPTPHHNEWIQRAAPAVL